MFVKLGASGVGELVDAAAVFLVGSDEAEVVQVLQGGIEGTGAGRIPASGALFEVLDDLVAVLGTIAQHVEDYVAQHAALQPLAGLTRAAAGAEAAPTAAEGSSTVLAASAAEEPAPIAVVGATLPGPSWVVSVALPGFKPALRADRVIRAGAM